MDFLFHKKNLLKKQMLSFFVVITSFRPYLSSLALLLNMENPRFFIFLGLVEHSTLLLLISVLLEDLFSALKIPGDI